MSFSLQDVDECAAPSEPCGPGHLCVNAPGSFRCECKAGYYFDGISRTCVGMWASLQASVAPGVTFVYASPEKARCSSPREQALSQETPILVPALPPRSRV